jgi:hypothetical protein
MTIKEPTIHSARGSENGPAKPRALHTEPGRLNKLRVPAALLLIFWAVAITLWRRTGMIFFLFDIGYIGTSLGVGTGLYALTLSSSWGLDMGAHERLQLRPRG